MPWAFAVYTYHFLIVSICTEFMQRRLNTSIFTRLANLPLLCLLLFLNLKYF